MVLLVCATLVSCTNRTLAPYVSEDTAGVGKRVSVLTVTSRSADETGNFTGDRGEYLEWLDVSVSIPPTHRAGVVEVSHHRPDPEVHFTIPSEDRLKSRNAFQNVLKARLAQQDPGNREIILFVHGYNSSYSDGLFRVAQLQNDLTLPGVMMHFSWPSAANPLGYSHDRDSVLRARDDFEEVLRTIRQATQRPLVIVAHSLGGLLTMETLRQIELGSPGWSARHVQGVALISPDIAVDVFRSQAARFKKLPDPFAIFASKRDPALMLSARVNGVPDRLGNLVDATPVADLPVTLIDVTAFSKNSEDRHFVAGTSPALNRILSNTNDLEFAFRGDVTGRAGLLPGTAISLSKATQVILSPNLVQ